MTSGLMITPLDRWVADKIGMIGGCTTTEPLKTYQLKRLNETITRARNVSPFYQRHLAGCETGHLTRLDDIICYPFTTAEDIAKQSLQMICVSQSDISRVVSITTSGTTGQPKRLYFTPGDQELTIDFFRCGMSTLVGPGDKTLILLPGERPGSVGDLLLKALYRIGVLPVPYGLVEQVEQAVMTVCQERTTCLVGVPVQILAMARYWERWGGSNWAPRCILLSTDYVSAAITQELQRIWNCEVYEHYGMTEMGLGGGIECAAHTGCHLREADLYFEIVAPHSARPVPDGEYGEVVVTTLTRQGMPLIRYRTGDIARLISGPCPCGSKLRRLERIRTRKNGMVRLGGGRVLTMADLDEVLFALTDVVNFTVEITYDKVIRLKVVVSVPPDGGCLNQSQVVHALRQLSAIRTAEREGRLAVETEVVRQWHLPPGKRTIHVVKRVGEAAELAT